MGLEKTNINFITIKKTNRFGCLAGHMTKFKGIQSRKIGLFEVQRNPIFRLLFPKLSVGFVSLVFLWRKKKVNEL